MSSQVQYRKSSWQVSRLPGPLPATGFLGTESHSCFYTLCSPLSPHPTPKILPGIQGFRHRGSFEITQITFLSVKLTIKSALVFYILSKYLLSNYYIPGTKPGAACLILPLSKVYPTPTICLFWNYLGSTSSISASNCCLLRFYFPNWILSFLEERDTSHVS